MSSTDSSNESGMEDPMTNPKITDDYLTRDDPDEDAFSEKDAKRRRGNFILPFGLPQSGKTTFLATLFRFLNESSSLDATVSVPKRNGVANYAGLALLNEWNRAYGKGQFLDPTPVGKGGIRELSYSVRPLTGVQTLLELNAVEVSGEDLRKIVAERARAPELPGAIQQIFANRRIRPMLLLFVHPDNPDNDELFNSLRIYMTENFPARMKTTPLCIVIANPVRAKEKLVEKNPGMQVNSNPRGLSGDECVKYLKTFTPRTFALYNSWNRKKRIISPLFIGETERVAEEGGGVVERILRHDDYHIERLFNWIYYQFTGKYRGQTWIQKLIHRLRN